MARKQAGRLPGGGGEGEGGGAGAEEAEQTGGVGGAGRGYFLAGKQAKVPSLQLPAEAGAPARAGLGLVGCRHVQCLGEGDLPGGGSLGC